MPDRPLAKFSLAALLGLLTPIADSIGPIAVMAAIAIVLVVALAWRSYAALAGGLIGIGVGWLALGVLRFSMSLCNGLGCGNTDHLVPVILLAGLSLVAGVLIGAVGLIRDVAKRRQVRP
jgi:hypothetical protein